MAAAPPHRFIIKYYPCGLNMPIEKDDVSTWPIYKSNDVPTGRALQAQLADYDPAVLPNTPIYLWDATACRPSSHLRMDDTLLPGEVCVLVRVKPEFEANKLEALELAVTTFFASEMNDWNAVYTCRGPDVSVLYRRFNPMKCTMTCMTPHAAAPNTNPANAKYPTLMTFSSATVFANK